MKVIFKNDYNYENYEKMSGQDFNGATGFCYNEKGEICIVFGDDGDKWQLVGGGRENDEAPKETFIREVMEEAQADVEDLEFFHIVSSEMYEDDGVTVLPYEEKLKYVERPRNLLPGVRFICKLVNMTDFIPGKYNDEITERKFVHVDELPKYFPWLVEAENGRETFAMLKNKLQQISF